MLRAQQDRAGTAHAAPRAARRVGPRDRCCCCTGSANGHRRRVPDGAQPWPGPVTALDFTGHGDSTMPAGGGYTPEILMADVDQALAASTRRPRRSITVLGRGLGAYIALLIAGARADQIHGAMLVDGPGLAGGPSGPTSQPVFSLDTVGTQPRPVRARRTRPRPPAGRLRRLVRQPGERRVARSPPRSRSRAASVPSGSQRSPTLRASPSRRWPTRSTPTPELGLLSGARPGSPGRRPALRGRRARRPTDRRRPTHRWSRRRSPARRSPAVWWPARPTAPSGPSWSASSSTAASSSARATTRLTKPSDRASSASNGRHVSTSSRTTAGGISRTSRGMPPQASGIPRSTSGIEKTVSSAATRRSHTPASTTPPPTHGPLIAAIVKRPHALHRLGHQPAEVGLRTIVVWGRIRAAGELAQVEAGRERTARARSR